MYSKETNSSAITGVLYSRGGHKLAAVSKDCSVCVYDATSSDLRLVGKTTVVGAAMCCDWSYDDSKLCVALSGGMAGLAIVDIVNCSVLSQEKVLPTLLRYDTIRYRIVSK